MTSMKIRTASIALIALAGMGCRDMSMDMDTGMNPADAGGDMGVRTDSATDMGMNPTDTGGNDVVMPPTDGGTVGVTIRQIQDLADPMHPASGTHVTVNEPTLVALTSRLITSSATGGTAGSCRFSVWVGTGATGDFTGILVQEQMMVGDAGYCSNLEGKIPANITPGTPITALSDLTYTEFCNGVTGTDRTMCHNWEQATLSIRGSTTLTMGVAVNAPSPTSATVPELGSMNANQPGTRSTSLEGGLVQVSNAFVHVVMTDSGFPDYYLTDSVGSSNEVLIETQNAFNATCIRAYLVAHDGMTIPSLRGPLEPSFGQWTIRLSSASDIGGLDCSRDGGTGVDAGD